MASSSLFLLSPSLLTTNHHRHAAVMASSFSFPNFRTNRFILLPALSRRRNDMDEQKNWILEKYGLDPSDFVDESYSEEAPKTAKERRKGRGDREEKKDKKGGKLAPAPEDPKLPRTTHKLLQVLGGKARRRKLLSPKGMDVRPMMEVVRGAAFDILQVAGGCPAALRPGRWLDLYSGTGSVGIEAISRGCSELVEYPLRTEMQDSCGPLVKVSDRKFGRTHLAIYGPTWSQKKRASKVLPIA
ncbi:unnamed protein product [Victoria cruziana]